LTPAARLAAAAEILDLIAQGRATVETVLKDWGRSHRFAGAKDRRVIAERVYQCVRAQGRLSHFMGSDNGRALVLGSLHLQDSLALKDIERLYCGEAYAPPALTLAERHQLGAKAGPQPQWLELGLPQFVAHKLQSFYGDDWLDEARALMLPRAPIDLRVTTDRGSLKQGLEILGYTPEFTPFSATGLRLSPQPPPNIRALPAFAQGALEIQDEGSQLAAFLSGAKAGMSIIDYCAGGGGKTMALLQMMGGGGHLIAADVEATRLANIKPRLKRAGQEAELKLISEGGEGLENREGLSDLVLVDAPCSGSGVWRRKPEAVHRLDAPHVARLHELQSQILARAAKLVKPGGLLAYVTCSVLSDENEVTSDRFEAAHPQFLPRPVARAVDTPFITHAGAVRLTQLARGHRLRLSPHSTQTDGFFIALYTKAL
jgi:16S rRNA (cytosine967-C5)-methyltransferase